MAHRVSWLRGHLGLGPGRIVDAHACDVSVLQGIPVVPPSQGETPAPPASLSGLIEDMDRAGVTASLVAIREETAEFSRLAGQHPGRLFGLAYYDSLAPSRGLARVQALCHDQPGLIVGVATAMPRFGQDPRLREFAPLYQFCMERDLPVQFHGGNDPGGEEAVRPTAFAVLARTYPRLKVIYRSSRDWHGEAPTLLHRVPNLFVQADGPSVPSLLLAVDSRRLLFGSHRQGRDAAYFEDVKVVRRLPWRARHDVGWRTAVRLYGPRLLQASSRFHAQPSSR
jgi:predicted TIM-barrel fold metal-dependent hydrolase